MQLPARLLRRRPKSHKNDYGHILILAGSLNFSGAGVLCAEATIRSGAGLVTLGLPESLALPIIKIKPKEVMLLPLPETKEKTLSIAGYQKIKEFIKKIDVLALGPGLGRNKSTYNLVRKIIVGTAKPMVIDADGLNALVGHLQLLKIKPKQSQPLILTPHSGEMNRLTGIGVSDIEKNRKKVAKKFASDYNVTVVVKGFRTQVLDWQGHAFTNATGNPGMATAGSGDVLAGMIAAFLGQGLGAFEAAKYGVYLHGLAGDLAAKNKTQLGMIASDIIDNIPQAIKGCS